MHEVICVWEFCRKGRRKKIVEKGREWQRKKKKTTGSVWNALAKKNNAT